MSQPPTEAERALEKLGQRLRAGFAKQHPTQEQDIQTALGAVREHWEQEQEAQRQKKPAPNKAPQREPEPPEVER